MGTKEFNEFFCKDMLDNHTMDKICQYIKPGAYTPIGYKTNPKCPVCNHILRPQVEELMYASAPPGLINEYVEKMGYKAFSVKTLKNHANEHCAVLAASKELAKVKHESRVEKLTQDLMSGSDALNLVINMFREKVESGEDVKVTAGNVIKAVETKNKIEGSVPLLDMMQVLFKEKEEPVIEGEVVEAEFEVSGGSDQPPTVEEDIEFFAEEREDVFSLSEDS